MTHDPKDTLDVNMKPKDIIRYRKTPLVVAVILFGVVLLYLILQLSHNTDEQMAQAKQNDTQTATIGSQKETEQYWFQDQKYDHIRTNIPQANPHGLEVASQKEFVSTAGAPSSSLLPSATNITGIKEENAQEQLEALHRTQAIEKEKMHYEAIRASARIAVPSQSVANAEKATSLPQNSPNTSSQSQALSDHDQDQKNAFLEKDKEEDVYLKHTKMTPLSATEIKAGTVIPAALLTGLNSDLPGSVIGQVRENVYDTATGNMLLIPQGAKLIGEYDSHVSFGQNRALVVWSRLIFPDGKSITLERMQGADVSGYAGFSDKVNNHYGRIYGNALLMSLLGSGYELLNKDVGNSPDAKDTVASSIGQQIAQVSNEMIRKNLTIQPTINIRSGYKFNVLVMKDVILEDVGKL